MPDCVDCGKGESVFMGPLRQSELPSFGLSGGRKTERRGQHIREHVVNGEARRTLGPSAGCVDVTLDRH